MSGEARSSYTRPQAADFVRDLRSPAVAPDPLGRSWWQLHEAYMEYVAACRAEECEPHTFHMWKVHGYMSGPI